MGEGKTLVYVVGFLGLLAAILGFAAEGTRIKRSDIRSPEPNVCVYRSTPAYILGYIAASLTLMAQIIVSVITSCGCCKRDTSDNTKSAGAIVSFVLSWLVSLSAISLLNSAANLSTRHEVIMSTGLCYTEKPGLFGAGACLALLACSLGLFSYLSMSKYQTQHDVPAVPCEGGIALGKPHQFS